MKEAGTGTLTEIETEQITTHAVVQPRIMDYEIPLRPRRDLRGSAEGLQALLPELRVQDD